MVAQYAVWGLPNLLAKFRKAAEAWRFTMQM